MGSFNELSPFLNDFYSWDRRWNRLERGREGGQEGNWRGTERELEGNWKGTGRTRKREENLNH